MNWETWEKSLMNELLVLLNFFQGLKGKMRRKKRKQFNKIEPKLAADNGNGRSNWKAITGKSMRILIGLAAFGHQNLRLFGAPWMLEAKFSDEFERNLVVTDVVAHLGILDTDDGLCSVKNLEAKSRRDLWIDLLLNMVKVKGFMGRNIDYDEEQIQCKGTLNLYDEGVRMTINLECKGITTADGLADVGAESSEGTAGAWEFSSRPKGKVEVKIRRNLVGRTQLGCWQ
ncbi:hypothetical protein DKX38_024206 [Salix brachista]|uniref:Uncharacterized protein n=1 Tax=Salix brachista TaxID=2182728 RepID=A0A5N5JYJ1_9ROSI|nr:hypothetical protein DKX38_024206 [Salix brachista]